MAADTNTEDLRLLMLYLWACACLPVPSEACILSGFSGLFRGTDVSVSEGFGTGGVGDGVGHGFLRVAAVVVDLEQDGEVHEHLQQAAGPELHRGLGQQEVARLEGVAAGPHQHHLDAGRKEHKTHHDQKVFKPS